jgi:hypothetical protein
LNAWADLALEPVEWIDSDAISSHRTGHPVECHMSGWTEPLTGSFDENLVS